MTPSDISSSSNFGFLKEHDPLFVELASAAERAFSSDPNTTLIKLRQLGEALAQNLAVRLGVYFDSQTSQLDLLNKVNRELQHEPRVREFFHTLRVEGNRATHQFTTKHKEAISGLKVARELAIWFHQAFGSAGATFNPGSFKPISDPSQQLRQLTSEISALKNDLQQASVDLDSSQQLNELIEKEKVEYEALALAMDEESRQLAQQAKQHDAELVKQQQAYEEKIKALQTQLAEQDEKSKNANRQQLTRKTKAASDNIVLDEELTRFFIDKRLQEAGWDADSEAFTYQKGTRPEKGKNIAIAEWPTKLEGKNGRADYVLFAGLPPLAIVEAKRENVNVSGKITQAERYSKGFDVKPPFIAAWELAGLTVAWPDEAEAHYKIPFVYSCNSRPLVPQIKEQSGTWFRDVRSPSELKRPLPKFHRPEDLLIYSNAANKTPKHSSNKNLLAT